MIPNHDQSTPSKVVSVPEDEPDGGDSPFEQDGSISPDGGEVPVEEDAATPPVHVSAAFEVRDADSASWVMRKINDARRHAQRVRAWAAIELRRAEREERWLLERFGRQLEDWVRRELGRQGGRRRRSVALPGGTAGLRRHPARLEVYDEPAASAWCRSHLPDALHVGVESTGPAAAELLDLLAGIEAGSVRVTRRVYRGILADHIKATGELPDGAEVSPANDEFFIK